MLELYSVYRVFPQYLCCQHSQIPKKSVDPNTWYSTEIKSSFKFGNSMAIGKSHLVSLFSLLIA